MSNSNAPKKVTKNILSVFVLLLAIISIFNFAFAAVSSDVHQTTFDDGSSSTQTTTATTVVLSRSNMTLYVGDKGYLTATILPSTAQGTVRWLSTNTNVAYASGGVVEAKGVGTATITARVSDTAYARCTVTVIAKPKCANGSILDGHSSSLKTEYINKTATKHDEKITCSTCSTSWTNAGIAHTYTNAVCKCGYAQKATSVTMSRTSATITKGKTLTLSATLSPSGSTGTIQWLSTKPDIASVSNGVVKANAVGTATITAKISDTVKATCSVTVVNEPKCENGSILNGHSSSLKTEYINKTATKHDEKITCSTCSTSWTNAGIAHTYTNAVCKCGYAQKATSVTMSRTSATITKGKTLTLSATLSPSGSTGTIQWLSTKPDIASVSNGVVKANAVGTATITAKISDTVKATCSVTVVNEPKCDGSGLLSGHDQYLTYTYSNKTPSKHDVTVKCTKCNSSWTNTGIAHIFANAVCKCGYKQNATSITMSTTSATITKGKTLTLIATLSPSGSTGTIQWLSTKPDIASVSNGVVKANAVGTATITAKISDTVKATCSVTVVNEPKCENGSILNGHSSSLKTEYINKTATKHDEKITCSTCSTSWTNAGIAHTYTNAVCKCGYAQKATSVTMSRTSATITKGKTLTLSATLSPLGSTGTIQWLSTKPDIASVSNGVVKANAVGTATITAKVSDTVKATCTVTVVNERTCNDSGVLYGHDQYLTYTYSNQKPSTHDVTIKCTKCNSSWTSTGIAHIFVNGKCKCGSIPKATGITLDKSNITLTVGDKITLTPTVTPSTAKETIQWLSTKTSVAYASNGVVEAKAPGTATITAKISDTVKATCTVTVVKKEVCNSNKILEGHTLSLKYTYNNIKTNTHDELVECTICNSHWTNSNKAHEWVNGTCKQCGKKPEATSITLNKTSAQLVEGQTLQLIPTLLPAGSEGTIIWTSSKTSVATVNGNGLVTAKKAGGTATITAKISDTVKATCTVTVVKKEVCNSNKILDGHTPSLKYTYNNIKTNTHDELVECTICDSHWTNSNKAHEWVNGTCKQCGKKPEATSITLNKTSAQLVEGQTLQLIPTLLPVGSEATITWTSSKTSVATVNGNGLVTAKKAGGSATITAKISSRIIATCKVTVVEVPRCTSDNILNGHESKIVLEAYYNKQENTHDEKMKCTECGTTWVVKNVEHEYVNARCACGVKQRAKQIVISQTTANIRVNESITLTAKVVDPEGLQEDFMWESNKPEVAEVGYQSGMVIGKKPGTAKITVRTWNEVKATCTVTVSEEEKCALGNILPGHEDKIKTTYNNKSKEAHDIVFKCEECGSEWEIKNIAHEYINEMCLCGRKEIHEYHYLKIDDNTHKVTCSTCNLDKVESHSTEKEICDCGFNKTVETCEHEYKWITIKDATCDEEGKQVEKCEKCGNVNSEKSILAKGHSFKATAIEGDYEEHVDICETCGAKGEKERHIYIWDKCITCKAERKPEKCQDGKAVFYHKLNIKNYKKIEDDEIYHTIVLHCDTCNMDIDDKENHRLNNEKICTFCGYNANVKEVCTAEKVIESHGIPTLVKVEDLKDGKNHKITLKCEKCEAEYDVEEGHTFDSNGKCSKCPAKAESMDFYYHGFGTNPNLDENCIESGKDGQPLYLTEDQKEQLRKAEYLTYTIFSAGVGNLNQAINYYKMAAETAKAEGRGPVYMTISLIEPAVWYTENHDVDSLVAQLNNGLKEYRQYITIVVVVGEEQRTSEEKTYKTTIDCYQKLSERPKEGEDFADVLLYKVDQAGVKDSTIKDKNGNVIIPDVVIEYDGKEKPHEAARNGYLEYEAEEQGN